MLSKAYSCEKNSQLSEQFKIDPQIGMGSQTFNAAYCRQRTNKSNANHSMITMTKANEMFCKLVDVSQTFLAS